MSEKIKEAALIVRIEHEKPIDSRALGYVLDAFSNEFDLFLMSSPDCEKYRDKDLILRIKKIKHGSIEIFFDIIRNININVDINFNIDIYPILLPSFFNHLKKSYSEFKKKVAKFVLKFKAKMNFEIEPSGNKTNKSFSINNKDAKEIFTDYLKDELKDLGSELSLVKRKQKVLENTFDTLIDEFCDKKDSNHLKSKLKAPTGEFLLVKEKQQIIEETLYILRNAFCDKKDSNHLKSKLKALEGKLLLVKDKQKELDEMFDHLTAISK